MQYIYDPNPKPMEFTRYLRVQFLDHGWSWTSTCTCWRVDVFKDGKPGDWTVTATQNKIQYLQFSFFFFCIMTKVCFRSIIFTFNKYSKPTSKIAIDILEKPVHTRIKFDCCNQNQLL